MAKRYIDADALADEIVNTLKRRDYASDSHTYACFKTFIEILDEAPTADVVEVVKCKDCEHYDISGWSGHERWCKCLFKFMRKDDFCSCGERRTDDGLY